MRGTLILVLAVLAAFFAPSAGARGRALPPGAETDGASFRPVYRNPVPGRIPMMMWRAWDESDPAQLTDAWFAQLADLGVNMVNAPMGDSVRIARALDLADRHGLKVMLRNVSLGNMNRITDFVRLWRGHGGVAGYMPADEPNCDAFPNMRALRDAIFTMDTTHLVLVNLLPIVPEKYTRARSYTDYVERAARELDLGFLSYDNYPIIRRNDSTVVRDTFYPNLEIVSEVARREGWPFWAFGLVMAHYNYPRATKAHLRFELVNALAYGAQGIQYWCYGMWGPEDFHTTEAPVDTLGRRMPVWYDVRSVSHEVQNLSDVFLGCDVRNVWHTGAVPKDCRRLERAPLPFTSIKSEKAGVLVSEITNAGHRYLVLCNHDVVKGQTVRLKWNGKLSRVYSNGDIRPWKKGKVKLDPGAYAIFSW